MAPVTGGEAGKLRVGKRGLFIDLKDKEYDAIVTEIVDNPISVKQAAFAPFRRAAAAISSKIEQYVATAQASQGVRHAGARRGRVTRPRPASRQAPPRWEPASAWPAGGDAAARDPCAVGARDRPPGLNPNSLILGGGMALAGIGAVLGGIFGVISSLTGWLAIIGVVLTVMGVSALLGWLKLRRRDMALLLEASGWAVNVHMTITPPSRGVRLRARPPEGRGPRPHGHTPGEPGDEPRRAHRGAGDPCWRR
nr:hypothetical protein [Deltaproteobacteria bacterium]